MPYSLRTEANLRILDSIIGSQRLEGLELDAATLAQLEQVAAGELDIETVIDTIKARQKAGEFRRADQKAEFSRA